MHEIKTKLAEFSAAHRLIKGYTGLCSHLHGHNYRIFLTFGSTQFDQYDFVVDFGEVKSLANKWVKENWDHTTIVSSDDHELLNFVQKTKQRHYIIPDGKNTTVEVLAHHLYEMLAPKVDEILVAENPTIKLIEVEIWETQMQCARFSV